MVSATNHSDAKEHVQLQWQDQFKYQNTQAAAGAASSYTLNAYLHQAPSTNERLTIDEIRTYNQVYLSNLNVETEECVAIIESVKSSKKPKTKSESKKKSQDGKKKKARKSEKL